MSDIEFKGATKNEEHQIRDEYNQFVIGSGMQCKTLHLPGFGKDINTLCDKCHLLNTNKTSDDGSEWKTKNVAVYPVGYRDICKSCVEKWRKIKMNAEKSTFDCTECDRGAVGLVKVRGNTLYGCNYHYRKAIEEYADVMDDNRLLPEQ